MCLKNYYTQVYSSVRYKSKRRGDDYPKFTKEQLIEWLIINGLNQLWINYLESGKDKNLKPSIDRIDPYKGYEFDNMQLITWRENHLKGVRSNKHKKSYQYRENGKPVSLYKNGIFVKTFKSSVLCAKFLGVHKVSISKVLNGRLKTIKKHTVKYASQEKN